MYLRSLPPLRLSDACMIPDPTLRLATDTQQKAWHDKHKASLTKGQRAAGYMRNGMGSRPFVVGFLGFMILWG